MTLRRAALTAIASGRLAAMAGLLAVAGCDGGSDLVGTWEPAAVHTPGTDSVATSPASRTTFFADGAARIITRPPSGPAETYDARYTVSGDTLLTLSDAQGAERFRLHVTPDTLVLESPVTGMRTVLVRVHAGG